MIKRKNPPWEKNIFFQKQGDVTVWNQLWVSTLVNNANIDELLRWLKNSVSTNNIVIFCAYIFVQYRCYLGFNPGMTKSYRSINFYQYTSKSPSKKSIPTPNPAYSEGSLSCWAEMTTLF